MCQGKSLSCVIDLEGVNTVITTTAYVLTPIVAIIGFVSWKSQYNIQLKKDDLKSLKQETIELVEILQYFDIHLKGIYNATNDPTIISLHQAFPDTEEINKELLKIRVVSKSNVLSIYLSYPDYISIKIDARQLRDFLSS